MNHRVSNPGLDLFVTGNSARNQCSLAAFFIGISDLFEQVLANCHADFIKLFLVAEAAGHAAALDLGGRHLESDGSQDPFRLPGTSYGFLLTVAMIEE